MISKKIIKDSKDRSGNADGCKKLKQSYENAEETVNLILGTAMIRPELRLEHLEGLEARYIRKTNTIVLNKNRLIAGQWQKNECNDTLAHELTHHAQMISNLYSKTGYFEKAYIDIDNKINEDNLRSASKNIKNSFKIANKLQTKVSINEIKLVDEGFKERVVNESLAYFIGAYAFSGNAGSNMHKKRSVMFNKLFDASEIAQIKRRNNIANFYLDVISKFAKPVDEKSKVDALRSIIRTGFVEERAKLAKKIAVIAFAENGFSVLKTAQFLFRPWNEVLQSIAKIAKSQKKSVSRLHVIDDIWSAKLGYDNKRRSIQKLIRGAIENNYTTKITNNPSTSKH